jgi:hypothetical protein
VANYWLTQDENQFEQRYRDLFDDETGLACDLLLLDRLAVGLSRARRFNRFVLLVWFEIKPPARRDTAASVRALAGGLRDAVRPDDTVARVGEWEFVALCNDLAHEDAVERIVRRLHNSIRKAMRSADGDEPLARIGTALGQPNQSPQHVLARAHKGLRALRTEVVSAVVS